MESMSVAEFRDFCSDVGYNDYIYDTDNQSKYDIVDMFSASLRFPTIHFSVNPSTIVLSNGNSKMVFDHVTNVVVHERKPCIGTCFEIICRHNGSYVRHNLIAD